MTVPVPPATETAPWFELPPAGASVANEYTPTFVGVPSSAFTNPLAAFFMVVTSELLIEPERSKRSAISRPHSGTIPGFERRFRYRPTLTLSPEPDAGNVVVLPEEIANGPILLPA